MDAVFNWLFSPREFSYAAIAGAICIGFWLRGVVEDWLNKKEK